MRNSDLVTIEIDPAKPTSITAEQEARLRALAEMPEADIDLSDIPEWTSEMFAAAVRPGLLVQIDSETIGWFEANAPTGTSFGTEINRVLREYVEARRRQGR